VGRQRRRVEDARPSAAAAGGQGPDAAARFHGAILPAHLLGRRRPFDDDRLDVRGLPVPGRRGLLRRAAILLGARGASASWN
jgi:hypothetical protein